MRRFLIKTLLFTLPILVVVVSVNYYVDPVGLFGSNSTEKHVAKILITGQDVAGLTNYDERLMQKEWINIMTQAPRTIVLGSSRGMLINWANVNDSTLVNNAVSGARFEDFLAILELYAKRDLTPSRVIIEVSPYMFCEEYDDKRFESLNDEFIHMAYRLGLNKSESSWFVNQKWVELFSISYFKSAVSSIGRPEDVIFPTEERVFKDHMIKKADGSITYSLQYQNRKVTQKDIADALAYGKVNKFVKLSKSRQVMFEALVLYLTAKGCSVDIVMFPYPEQIIAKLPIFIRVEQYLTAFANSKSLRRYGSFSCSQNNRTIDDFYDGMHSKQHVTDRIFENGRQ